MFFKTQYCMIINEWKNVKCKKLHIIYIRIYNVYIIAFHNSHPESGLGGFNKGANENSTTRPVVILPAADESPTHILRPFTTQRVGTVGSMWSSLHRGDACKTMHHPDASISRHRGAYTVSEVSIMSPRRWWDCHLYANGGGHFITQLILPTHAFGFPTIS